MRFPIDASRLQFLVVAEAEPLKQYEEGKPREAWAPRVDTNGELLWRVQLVAFGDGGAEIIKVTVPGDPHVGEGELVRVDGLTAQRVGDGGPLWPVVPRRDRPAAEAARRREGCGVGRA